MTENKFSPYTDSPFTSNPSVTIPTKSLETLTIESLTLLESLIETSGELFNSLLEYSQGKTEENDDDMEEEKRQKVTQCYEKYKKSEKELRKCIVELEEKKERK